MINNVETNEEVLTRIGHDLNGMIARIRSCNYVLYKKFEDEMDSDSCKFYESIERDCAGIKSIIHNLIDVDQSYEENPDLKLKITHINAFVADVVKKFHMPSMDDKNISIHFEDTEEPIHIYMDENAIQRVVDSILSNAVKFSTEGGEIIVKLIRYANVAHISISDQGIGIPKKLRPYMFSKFSKATRRGTAGEDSSGLGMFLARKVVENHQGSIWYESEEEVGTNFFLNLPIKERIHS